MNMGIDCRFARVSLWDTKSLAKKSIARIDDETDKQLKGWILEERYRLFMDRFRDYPRLHLSNSKFSF